MHKTALINARSLGHDFGVKLSPCMCSHVGIGHGGSGYMYVLVDSDKSGCVPY